MEENSVFSLLSCHKFSAKIFLIICMVFKLCPHRLVLPIKMLKLESIFYLIPHTRQLFKLCYKINMGRCLKRKSLQMITDSGSEVNQFITTLNIHLLCLQALFLTKGYQVCCCISAQCGATNSSLPLLFWKKKGERCH